MEGWISIERGLMGHWVWENPKHLRGWIYILLRANYSAQKVKLGSKIVPVKRGQFITSISNFGQATGMTDQEVRTYWNLLESDDMITKESTRIATKITVCKYDTYQDKQQTSNTRLTKEQQSSNKGVTTDKKEKKDNNDKKEKNIPAYEEFKTYALENKPKIDLSALELKYKSWVENGWKDGNNKPIKNWKSKLLNTLPYLNQKSESKNLYPGYVDSSFDQI